MAAKEFVESVIAQNRFLVFGTTTCPYTARSKELILKDYSGVPVKEVNLDILREGSDIRDYLASITGQTSTPNIFINNRHVGGADELESLHRDGRLRTMLAEGGANTRPL